MEHKFFERFLDIDLDSLYDFLIDREADLLSEKFPGIHKGLIDEYRHENDSITLKLLNYYNIFALQHPALHKLYSAVRDMTKEACDYYGIDWDKEQYYVQGWVNIESYDNGMRPSPDFVVTDTTWYDLDPDPTKLHEHNGGLGMPDLHGYFCVYAEPSVTHYMINKETPFKNINKNGRAILSETGHPHSRGYWPNQNKRRITIAYDTLSKRNLDEWSTKGNPGDLSQHWIPLA